MTSASLRFLTLLTLAALAAPGAAADPDVSAKVWTTAYAVPKQTTNQGSGYFSIIEGRDGKFYIGTAKYGHNAYLVSFDPAAQEPQRKFSVVVDAQRELGSDAVGFAAQAKIHTRNNVGSSGRIYFGTKQGQPQGDESREDYAGGHPMSYDPRTGETRVYDIPVPHHGIISVTPDESRGAAYISTCSDERPVESTHFLILDLKSGEYRDLMDCRHMYAFIVVDHRGRAYHPVLGGRIARYDPRSDQLQLLTQTIDGQPPDKESLLAAPESHPINWDLSPDRRTLYAVAMSGNQLYAYDLGDDADKPAAETLAGRRLGALIAGAEKTDCRAMCVGPDGVVWAGVAATFARRGQELHLVSYRPGVDIAPVDHGVVAISNPQYTEFTDEQGRPLPWHHGVHRLADGALVPRYNILGICAARSGSVYLTTLAPFTLHEIRFPQLAVVSTAYRHNAHTDVIASRLIQTSTLDNQGRQPQLKLASLYTDQVPDNDLSRPFSKRYGFPVYDTVAGALTRGGQQLAVDGVLLIAEHGQYPRSATSQIMYPKRRLFEQVVRVFDDSGRVAPVFIDKHLADNWEDAHWIYQAARRRNIPLMAGSSLPVLWRQPPVDVTGETPLKEILAVSYHTLDAYGFHALELTQALAERRRGGETGVKAVQCLTGEEVWQAGRRGDYDARLLASALARQPKPVAPDQLSRRVREPVLFTIDYEDGLRASVLTLNGAVSEWTAAWRYADSEEIESTLFRVQQARPYHHFQLLLNGIEQMMRTGQPSWPVERTLLTSGLLDSLLISKQQGGRRLPTPHLRIRYQSDWHWQPPPPPPADRPSHGQ